MSHPISRHPESAARALWLLSLGALGIVYGDIGTSPLYAMRECFLHAGAPAPSDILGVVSLVFWALTLVICVKYLAFILRADNKGEGGILALLALGQPRAKRALHKRALLMMGLIGSSLLIADGIITPAISVLSAVEGLEVAAPSLHSAVVPVSFAILLGLFAVQRRGTGQLGAFFGPAVLLWFLSIGATGLPWIVREPRILAAVNPLHALSYLTRGMSGYLVLGAVVLCVTGGEALYADLGHFGRQPIKRAWFCVAFPGLLLSYFGQGAYLLTRLGQPVGNPFYEMVPAALQVPMIFIATIATVVASQALITGVYAIVHQGVQLGHLPRVTVVHTSRDIEGRIYIPQANFLLMAACLALVVYFRSSSALASAYGIAVTGNMCLTSLLFYPAMRERLGWITLPLTLGFLVVDLAFLGANLHKVGDGGWVPLAVAVFLVSVMTSWRRGTEVVSEKLRSLQTPLIPFIAQLGERKIARVPGTAVFLAREAHGAPPMLVHYVEHSLALQEHVILLSVQIDHHPRVSDDDRIESEALGEGFYRVRARYGFMEAPDLVKVLAEAQQQGVPVELQEATIFVGHSTVVTTGRSRMAQWRKNLFELLNRNARPASTHYQLPSGRVVEIGVRIEI